MKQIVFASGNKNKLKEVKAIIGDIFDVLSPGDFGIENFEVDEDKPTIEGNALKKAKALYELVKIPVLADDTGLFVDFLNGEPGVYSARYSGENATFESNNLKLLSALENVEQANRSAEFRTAMAYIDENGDEEIFVGLVKGQITTELKGSGGFGYDPIFYVSEFGKTLAEMDKEEKNKVSHRANSLMEFRKSLL